MQLKDMRESINNHRYFAREQPFSNDRSNAFSSAAGSKKSYTGTKGRNENASIRIRVVWRTTGNASAWMGERLNGGDGPSGVRKRV